MPSGERAQMIDAGRLTFGSAILESMFADCGTNVRESDHTRGRRYSQPRLPAAAFARRISYVRPRDSRLARDKPGPAHRFCAGALCAQSTPGTFNSFMFITYIRNMSTGCMFWCNGSAIKENDRFNIFLCGEKTFSFIIQSTSRFYSLTF